MEKEDSIEKERETQEMKPELLSGFICDYFEDLGLPKNPNILC